MHRVEIPGFPDYSFNELGEVFKNGIPKKVSFRRRGRQKSSPQVIIRINGKCHNLGLGKLIANEFIPNPKGYEHIIFKDGNSHNCKAHNISWVDSQVYMYYCTRGKRKPKIINNRTYAIEACTDFNIRNYYITLDEEWLYEAWKKVDMDLRKFPKWHDVSGEVYLLFRGRVKRFSIWGKPEGICWFLYKGEIEKLARTISPNLSTKKLWVTDESLRFVKRDIKDPY